MKKNIFWITLFLLVVFSIDTGAAARYHGARRKEGIYREETAVVITGKDTPLYSKPAAVAATPVLPAPAGPKKLVAVAEFENKTGWAGQVNLGIGMADQLITVLMETGMFIVLERESLEAILREQNFGASGRAAPEGGAGIGKLTRAQILIQGAVTEFEQRSSSGAGGITVQGFSFYASEAMAHVAVDVRIYDTTTGQIIASRACKGTAKDSGGSFGYADCSGYGFTAGGSARTPLDFAVREAINNAVQFIILELRNIPWSGRVAMVKEDDIYINCGRTAGIIVGDQFSVWRPGEAIVDPETGITLGSEDTKIGMIEVIKVEEKYAKAVPVNGAGFARNDIVKFAGRKPPEPVLPAVPLAPPPLVSE